MNLEALKTARDEQDGSGFVEACLTENKVDCSIVSHSSDKDIASQDQNRDSLS